MAQNRDADFFLNGRGMVLGSVANCCLDSFPVWVIAEYLLEFINWRKLGAYRCWRQCMIHKDFVQVNIPPLKNVAVEEGCSV